jgi:hypothetical protein
MIAPHGIDRDGGHLYTLKTQMLQFGIEAEGKLGCLGRSVNHFTAFVVAAGGTDVVGQLLLVAIRAFGQGKRRKEIMGATLVLARMGVTSFRIRHCKAPLAGHGSAGLKW